MDEEMKAQQFYFIQRLYKLQTSINGKSFEVCKRDKNNEPTEHKPFHQVTELYFPVDDCDLPYSVMVLEFDGDRSYTPENKARGRAVTEKLTSWLKWKGIPFYVFDHGPDRRSPHTWIFFKLPDSALGGPDKNRIKSF